MKSSTAPAEKAVMAFARSSGLLRARDLKERGIPTIALTRMVKAGKIERVSRGVYALSQRPVSAHHSLAEVAVRVPRGVVCLLSALRVHEIGTQAPFEVWLAVPNHVTTPRLDQPALRIVRMSPSTLKAGVERVRVDGVPVPVFSAAKTVADCFKYRNKVGIDVAVEALRDFSRKHRGGANDLARFARLCRVSRVMQPYLDAIA